MDPDATPPELLTGHGGHHVVAALSAHGVSELFTLSGGHVFPIYDAAVSAGLPIFDVRHEQTATFAAEGVAKLRARPGVAVLTAGPGVTNGISAMTSAHMTGSPLVVLGGRAPSGRWGQGSLQELDHVPIVESITKLATTAETTASMAANDRRPMRRVQGCGMRLGDTAQGCSQTNSNLSSNGQWPCLLSRVFVTQLSGNSPS